ncbi:MAG TPA: penicillin-binding protein 2 [Miltoncostaeaceae bacterium]|jgi:penicillin-binding protein 2|nr:penicillin-binding protein 2 [Miltoncostaeaceae bacterium]
MTTTFRPRRPGGRVGGGGGGGWAPALTPRIAVRIAILGGIAMTLLGILLVRLWFLQVISGEQYAERAEGNRLRTVITEAPRGNIVDRNGNALVNNAIGENLVAQPRDLEGQRRVAVLTRLAGVIGVPAAQLIKEVGDGDDQPLEPVILARNVDPGVSQYLAERQRDFPGISLKQTYLRSYPEAATASHILGQTGRIGPNEIAAYRRKGYQGDETVGKGGIEQQYEEFLTGTPGRSVVEVDASGEPQGREYLSSVAPVPGRTIQLSIDLKTQEALEAGLADAARVTGAKGAAGVAMDPRTGEVLALGSFPTFNPEIFVKRKDKEITRINRDEDRPLLDRAIQGVYPAGSTFKPITAAAGIQGGELGVDEELESVPTITLHKQEFSNFERRGHGWVDLPTALEVSSDTFFYQVADRLWQAQDTDRRVFPLQAEAREFGLGRDTGIDLPGESPALVPDPPWKKKNFAGPDFSDFDRSWLAGDTIQLGVGQGYLLVTPVQMAVAYAAIANGGTIVSPTVAQSVRDPNGRVVQKLSAGRPTRHIEIAGLEQIRDGLHRAANGVNGTSTSVFANLPDDAKVAGKTGTAEPGDGGEDHSWFVGYAPYDDPSIVVAVVIERGGTGANAAAPVVCRTMGANLGFDGDLCGQPTVESR